MAFHETTPGRPGKETVMDKTVMDTNGSTGSDRVSGAIEVMRATVDQVGERLPGVVDTVREGATGSARAIDGF